MKIQKTFFALLVFVHLVILATIPATVAAAADECGNSGVDISINIGCEGKGNAIIDMLKAITRFLSVGVGIVVVISLIVAGIQYMTSAGNPQALQSAKSRIANAIIALLVFFFMFAIIQFLIPTDF